MGGVGIMESKLAELIKLVRRVPERRQEEAREYLSKLIRDSTGSVEKPVCAECGSAEIVRNGTQNGGQRYRCRSCGKVFSGRRNTVMYRSHSSEAEWRQVIRDTIEGKAIAKTARELELTEATTFNMRHKILLAIERLDEREPKRLAGVCELDETFVLENYKGRNRLLDDFWREPRRHGAKARKRGISNEYVALCTGVGRFGGNVAVAVSRATPGGDEIARALGSRIENGTLVLTDGNKDYKILEKECGCEVMGLGREASGPSENINTANAFHSFIKERLDGMRGVATKYLNRYAALFAHIWRGGESVADDIYNELCSNAHDSCCTISDVRSKNLTLV
jgi:transposase-like protein